MDHSLQVLIVGGNRQVAGRITDELRNAGFQPESYQVDSEEDFLARLHPGLDVILADDAMQPFGAARALELLGERSLDLPFIVVSSGSDEKDAIGMMRAGALDYFLDDRLARLGPRVGRVLERRRINTELNWKTAFLEAQINSSIDGILVVDAQGKKILQNPRLVELLEIPSHVAEDSDDAVQVRWVTGLMRNPESFISKVVHLYSHPDEISRDEVEMVNGRILDRYSAPVLDPDGKSYGRIWTFRDITERKKAELELLGSQLRYRSLFENMLEGYSYCELLYDDEGRADDFIYLEVNHAFGRLSGLNDVAGRKVSAVVPGILQSNPEIFEIYGRVVRTGLPERYETHVESLGVWFSVSVYCHEPGHFVAVFDNVTESKRATAELLNASNLLQSTLDALSEHIAILDEQGTIIKVNAAWDRFAGENAYPGTLHGVGENYLDICDSASGGFSEEGAAVAAGIRAVMAGRSSEVQLEYPCHSPREQRWFVIRATRFRGDGPVRVVVAHENITARKVAVAELENTFRELVETSRLAGMAEVATGVLHNVGNVLNSVNVASSCLSDRLRKSKVSSLSKVVDLLQEHEADLPAFFTHDPQGLKLPGFLGKLAAQLLGEQEAALKELGQLQKDIEHIKDIVGMQQGFARVSGVTETLSVSDLLDDALKLNSSSLSRHEITVFKDYQEVPPVTVERHKVLQILVNLVRNAKQACEESPVPEKRLTLRVSHAGERVGIAVIDNGIGISAENLTHIFAHGFTTKASGHGFGLHSAALAAMELGGSLHARSDGPGMGATFTLEIPVEPLTVPVRSP